MSGRIFIGLPVRNGEAYLRIALDSVLSQQYRDWQLLIADNCSTDRTVDIANEYARRDSRIAVLRHEGDIGAIANFVYCARACPEDMAYFTWFAHDDIWQPEFLSSAVSRLARAPWAGYAWTNVYSLDKYGQYQGVPADYARYAGHGMAPAVRYIYEHEVCGKAMLIYSVFRPALVRAAIDAIPVDYGYPNWDNIFNLACISRASLTVDRRHLFGKRAVRSNDAPGQFEPWRISFDRQLGLPMREWNAYFDAMRAVVAGTKHERWLYPLITWRKYTRGYFIPRRQIENSDIVMG